MIETYLGEIIRKNRIAQGLSQEKLCEGICDPATLSRIENGVQMPSRNRAVTLLQRLGLSSDRYYMMISKYDADIDKLALELSSFSIQYERSYGAEKEKAKKHGLKKLQQLEEMSKKDDVITQQLILHFKVNLASEADCSLDRQLALLMDAICLTIPQFDLDSINKYLYSLKEIEIITLIACRFSKMGELRKSVKILEHLYEYVQKHNQNMTQSAGLMPFVAYHYAIRLSLSKRYSDAKEVAEIGKKTCIDFGSYNLLPGFLHIMAECQYFTGNVITSKNLYTQAYYLYQVLDNERDLEILKGEATRYLGILFED